MSANARIRSAIDDIFCDWDRSDSPGIAVGVVHRGEPIYARGFGLANVEHRVPIDTSTVFDIGSVTKQFTAFAVLMLVRQGKLNLDDRVREFVPEMPDHDPPIRVRHCLYHTSGLTDWVEALELSGPIEDYCSTKRVFRTVTALRETMFAAGQGHSYSNTGYLLLAWIVSRVSGMTLAQFLQVNIFDPLGMTSSSFRSEPGSFVANQAQGYFRDDEGQLSRTSFASDAYGDGMMHASIDDMTCWLQNLVHRTVGDDGLFEAIFAPGELDDGRPIRYGGGWQLERYRGLTANRHGGMSVGFQSHVAWFPSVGVGVAILGNVRPYLPWPLADAVLDAVLESGWPRIAAAVEPDPPPCRADDDFEVRFDNVGRHFTATGLPVTVERFGDGLRIDTWLWRRPFVACSEDVFTHMDSGDRAVFGRNDEGRVMRFELLTDDGACPPLHSFLTEAIKFEPVMQDDACLAQFAGRYINEVLDTVYTVVVEKGGLRARHQRCWDWHLRPIRSCLADSFGDEFSTDGGWPGRVTFSRHDGVVDGFRVRGTRMHVKFRKFAEAPA